MNTSAIRIGTGTTTLLAGLCFAAPWANAAPGRNWRSQGPQRDLDMPDYSKLASFGTGVPFLAPRTLPPADYRRRTRQSAKPRP